MAAIDPGAFETCFLTWVDGVVLVVWKLDRLARSLKMLIWRRVFRSATLAWPSVSKTSRLRNRPITSFMVFFTIVKQMAANLTHRATGKHSMRLQRKAAGCDDDLLGSLVRA